MSRERLDTEEVSSETRLLRDLKRRQRSQLKEVRPARNVSEITDVNFGLSLISIDSIEHTNALQGVITVSVWVRQNWKDFRWSWHPDEYDGISEIHVPIDWMWRPDIVLYNNMAIGHQLDEGALAVVSCFGDVLWIPQGKLTVRVDKNPSNWFHQNEVDYTASFKFGSWTYDGFKIDLNFYNQWAGLDTNDYISSNLYYLSNATAVKNVLYYPCCMEPYPSLTFRIDLKNI